LRRLRNYVALLDKMVDDLTLQLLDLLLYLLVGR
jgi:hypothetical protein